MYKVVFSLFYLTVASFGATTYIEFIGTTQYLLTQKGVKYSINSQKRVIKPPKKVSIFKLLSRKHQIASNSSYYLNGVFKDRKITVKFKKAYWLEGVFYMEHCKGKLPKFSFTADEVAYGKNRYKFKKIKYKKENITYIKHSYSLSL